MVREILHVSQWCYNHKLNRLGAIMEKIMILTCSAHISGKAKIHPTVSFSHGGIGVVINPAAEVGEFCIINNKVTLGNGFPHGGAPKLGKHVYIGTGAFLGGGISVADYVIVGANSVLTKSVAESGVIVAGVPAKVLRKLTPEELKQLDWEKR